jgi:hypothetical protein
MQVFSRLVADLINAIKQKSATILDGARVNYKDLILVPEYIYDETSHAADVTRNVLVLDNLEEKQYFASVSGTTTIHCSSEMSLGNYFRFSKLRSQVMNDPSVIFSTHNYKN